MDYKKFIKNRNTRYKILTKFDWVPDRIMLRIQYRLKMGFWPHFRHPKRFTEKLQLYKLYYHNPVMPLCVDKYDVRSYVEQKGLGYILNECYGVYEKLEDIDWSNLPNQFVMKKTTGGGGLNVAIVRDKGTTDMNLLKNQARWWTYPKSKNKPSGREWAYQGLSKNRVIFEKLIIDDSNLDGSIDDYKFMCFDGKCRCIWVDKGRYSSHKRGFWDENLNYLNGYSSEYPPLETPIQLPENIGDMIKIAEKLSEDFPHARIDLFNVRGNIIFGEITFYSSSGYADFHPDSFDLQLGSYFNTSSFYSKISE